MNDCGVQKYDNAGMCEGGLLTANDVGVQKYDFMGLPEGFIGTSVGTATPKRMLLGVGI